MFYDFHPNGASSLNGFEQVNSGYGVKTGMVRDTLDSERKPILRLPVQHADDSLHAWFRPYARTGSNQFVYNVGSPRPVTTLPESMWVWTNLVSSTAFPRGGGFVTSGWADYTTTPSKRHNMTNIVLYDSLPFRLQDSATGTYSFVRNTSNGGFFWLDSLAFGNEPTTANPRHNFGFTMEMHHQFTYKGDEFFQFSGDDDVWVFINNKLAVDLGGVHSTANGSITLSGATATNFGLIKGRKYMFDMFYCERRTSEANCRITTNILTPSKPNDIIITFDPNPPDPLNPPVLSGLNLTAGQCTTFHTWVVDDTNGLRPEWDTLVKWIVVDTVGNTVVYDTISNSNQICLTKAHGCTKIYFTFTDPKFPTITLTDSVEICVQPAAPSHMVIEAQRDVTGKSRFDNPVDTLTIPSTVARDSVYAVLRDQYGNYVRPDTLIAYTVIGDAQANVTAAVARKAFGEGELIKVGPPGADRVFGVGTSGFRDTFVVNVTQTAYSQLRIAVGEGGLRTGINTLSIQFTQDTLLYVEGLRQDGLGWEQVAARWTLTGLNYPVPPAMTAPASGNFWLYQPPDTGRGTMTVILGTQTLSIPVTVAPGGPASVRLYPASGTPGPPLNPIYGSPATAVPNRAGQAIPLSAKIFDPYGTWLGSYETDGTKAPLFTWEVRNASTGSLIAPSMGSLSASSGQSVQFTPYYTGVTLNIISTFTEGANLFRDTVKIYVTSGSLVHLVIEPSADSTLSPHADNPIDPIQLLAGDTVRNVFAILRDQYGNFAGYASASSWLSRDLGVCSVFVSQASTGRATIRRTALGNAQAQILATQGAYVDSALVVAESITYTGLRIVYSSGGLRDIDTLRLRTDSTANLLVLGQRSDNGQWVLVPATWSTSGVTTSPAAPAIQSDNWTFAPAGTATGRIIVTKTVGTVTARDTVVAIFTNGLPSTMALYRQSGAPGGSNTQYLAPPAVDTLIAGTAINLYAKIFDHRAVYLSAYATGSAPVTWSRNELSGNPPTGTLAPLTGHGTTFTPTRAYNTVEIVATFTENGITLVRATRFFVRPDTVSAMHLVVEASPLRTVSPNADVPVATITIPGTDTVGYAYAILRDRFGNFVRPVSTAGWTSANPSVVTPRVGIAANGEGVLRRVGAGQTDVEARSGALFDSVRVFVSNVIYDSLRIVDALTRDIIRDTVRTDQTRSYFVIGHRTDNGEWDNVAASWRVVGLSTTPAAPAGAADQWTYQPALHNQSGRVVVSLFSGTQTRYDSVFVVFQPGLPSSVVLFPAIGTPYQGANQPYAPPATTDTMVAGTQRLLVAKVFDHRGVWLTQYETPSAPVSWSTVSIAGGALGDTLSRRSGDSTRFSPVDAHKTLYIISEFSLSGIVLRDSVRIRTTASTANHLVIEASADPAVSPNADRPLYGVTLSSRDTITTAYAILRDQYGNFVDYCRQTLWASLDTAIVKARAGVAALGEGAIVRVAIAGGSTRVSALNTADTSMRDTIDVDVNDVTYDSLRIVVNSSGLRDLDTLRMRTDQDTTLFVLGRRSDNGQWDNVRANWGASGVQISPVAPPNVDRWALRPSMAGNGTITVSYVDSAGRTITDRVVAVFSPGLPRSLVIYPKSGVPGVNDNLPYPPASSIDTITAGDSLPLVGKLFDNRGVWLGQYEAPGAPVQWTVSELGGTPPSGILTQRDGFVSAFLARNARNRLYVIAQYTAGSFADTVQFYVQAGSATHLVLEASPDPAISPTEDNPIGSITVGQRDTVANVYAVLRDQFGNFVGYASDLDWNSTNAGVVTAGPGNTNIGEGRIIRASPTAGTTTVIVRSRTNPLFADTISVTLSTVSYDSLRVVNDTGKVMSSLSWATDSGSYTLMVQGKNSASGRWEYVPARWQFDPSLRLSPAAPASDSIWTFTATDTGRGTVWVSLDDKVSSPVTVVVGHGAPIRLALYGLDGAPSAANPPLSGSAASITVAAGDTFDLVAKIFDHRDVWLSEYELNSAPIQWRVEETNNNDLRDSLSRRTGYATQYAATQARRTIYVIGSYVVGQATFSDTVRLTVTPGIPARLYLEPDQAAANYERPNPVDTLTLTFIDTYRRVYAVVRDRFGNFVDYSQRTRWFDTDSARVVSVADGISSIGEGLITKVYSGPQEETPTKVYAHSDAYPGLGDTVNVRVLKIFFTELRITLPNDTVALPQVVMFTDDDTTLRVQGKRNDNGVWVDVTSRWQTSSALWVTPDAPELAGTWKFSPRSSDTSGTGWIRVTLDVDSITKPDTVPVVFKLSPPSSIDFWLLTPTDSLMAGDTITAVVRIRNRDGLLPGSYCRSGDSGAIYASNLALSDTSRRPPP